MGGECSLPQVDGYNLAFFGFYRMGFLADDGLVYLDESDRESLKEALFFYDEYIRHLDRYPYINQLGITKYMPGEEILVLKQVLGLPDAIFNQLDLNENILSQLHFRKNLFSLKRHCYSGLFKGRRWTVDEFKNETMRRGLFFLYDGTKIFLYADKYHFPVFIDEKKIDGNVLKAYDSFCAERLAIDLMHGECEETFLAYMKRFDSFSFNDLLMYFVDKIDNPAIARLADDPKRNAVYTNLLKNYFVGIINLVFDEYYRRELNILTNKLSFLSIRKAVDSPYFVLASFQADMYSKDGKEFFFSEQDRKRIRMLYKDALQAKDIHSPALIYSRLFLPYEGFRQIKDDPDLTRANLFKKLHFQDGVDRKELFLGIKRYGYEYSYVPGSWEHLSTFLKRWLLYKGILYYSRKDDEADTIRITVKVFPTKRDGELQEIFDMPTCSMEEHFLVSYWGEHREEMTTKVLQDIHRLDVKSENTALSYFYSALSDSDIGEALTQTFSYFHLPIKRYSALDYFFKYLVDSLLTIARDDFRLECLKKGDTVVLSMIDGMPKMTETYEPDLPLPYVIYGEAVYSFREKYFSPSYICSCQKKALEERIDFFQRHYWALHLNEEEDEDGIIMDKEDPQVKCNTYVLDHLGLPEDVYHRIDCSKDIAPQIAYKDHICHLCTGQPPLYHDVIFDNAEAPQNAFFTYIRAVASENGVHLETHQPEKILSKILYQKVTKKEYTGIVSVDPAKIRPYFRKYIELDELDLVGLFVFLFPQKFQNPMGFHYFTNLLSYPISSIRDMLFQCHKKDYDIIYDNPEFFSNATYFYNRLSIAYAIKEAKKKIPGLESETFVDTIHVEGLKKPYVYLGRIFDAYSDTEEGEPIFCECDRKAMRDVIDFFLRHFSNDRVPDKYLCPFVLGLSGLPFEVIHRLRDFPLNSSNIDVLMSKMSFEPNICHRCQHVNIPSIGSSPMMYLLPRKENHAAEFISMLNLMAKDGFLIPYDVREDDIVFNSEYYADLEAPFSRKLPYFFYLTYSVPPLLVDFFTPSESLFESLVKEFITRTGDSVSRIAARILREAYGKDKNVFLRMMESLGEEKKLRDTVWRFFPELETVWEKLRDGVAMRILGFMTLLFENLIQRYLGREGAI